MAKIVNKRPLNSTSKPAPASPAKKNIKWIRYALILLLGVLLLGEWNGTSGLRNMLRLRMVTNDQREQMAELAEKQKALALEKAKLESDSAYLENVARKELGMARPDEKVFRYVPSAKPGPVKNRRE